MLSGFSYFLCFRDFDDYLYCFSEASGIIIEAYFLVLYSHFHLSSLDISTKIDANVPSKIYALLQVIPFLHSFYLLQVLEEAIARSFSFFCALAE